MTRFRILGPVGVWDGDRRVAIGGPQQQALLALLLLERNAVVSAERLIDELWGSSPPVTARSLLHGCVAQLRRALTPLYGGRRQPLETREPGYLLVVEPGELDLDRFHELDREALGAVEEGPAGALRAADLWKQALELWRGPALGGLALDACRREAARLDELRVDVLEKRIDAGLRSRKVADLGGELGALVVSHPLRERLWAQLMVVLYETGRRAEALEAYRRLRDSLVGELGVEPGPAVRDLHQVLLTDGDVLAAYVKGQSTPVTTGPGQRDAGAGSDAWIPPAELPRATRGFVGRVESLDRLDGVLGEVREQTAICVVTGMAGVGKTELAVTWAHRVRDRFPDGQLFVNLRGHTPNPPVAPVEALVGFLRALGVPAGRLPDDLARAAAQYRSLLSGKRVLVLLDDAASADQVRSLLPGGDGCLVLVTSRHSLGGLVAREGAQHVALDTLDHDDALDLVRFGLGTERISGEPDAAAELVDLCTRLPLALRIVTARLLLHPDRRLAEEVAGLSSGGRLGALEMAGDESAAVRAVFERSYATVGADARRLFRLLGQVPLSDVCATTAAALMDTKPAVTAKLLEDLADAHLVTRLAPGRFGLHDLLRLYATDRVLQDEPAVSRAAAAYRLMMRLVADADAADRLLNPNRVRLPLPDDLPHPTAYEDRRAALAWLDTEFANLVTVVRYAADHGPRMVAWLLATTLKGYCELRMRTQEWRTMAVLGLAAAEVEGNDVARAHCHVVLGALHERLGDYELSGYQTARALVLARRAGWQEGEVVALSDLGILCRHAGRLDVATNYAVAALALARKLGGAHLVASRLMSLGNLHAEAGDLTRAAELYAEVLPMFREIGASTGEAIALANLGECRVVLGRPEEAVDYFTAAATLNREVGHRSLAADNLRALATAHVEAGRAAVAIELAEAALTEHRATGDRRYEADSLNVLGTAHQRGGDLTAATECHRQALEISRRIGVHRHEVVAMIGLARCADDPGRLEATEHARAAVDLARGDGLRLLEGPALTALATVLLTSGDLTTATEQAEQALAVQRETNQRLGQARALEILGEVAAKRGAHDRAVQSWRRAQRLYEEAGVPEARALHQVIEQSAR